MNTEHPLVPRHIILHDIEWTTEDNGDGTVTFIATQGVEVHHGESDDDCERCYPDVFWLSRG